MQYGDDFITITSKGIQDGVIEERFGKRGEMNDYMPTFCMNELYKVMEGHVLGQATLKGSYAN